MAGANTSSLPVWGHLGHAGSMDAVDAGSPCRGTEVQLWALCTKPRAQSCLCSSHLNCIATPRRSHWVCSRVIFLSVRHPNFHIFKCQQFSLCFHALLRHNAGKKKQNQGRTFPQPLIRLCDCSPSSTVCREKARNVSDGTSRLDWKVRHPLTINWFAFSLQAVSFYSKSSTLCKPGVQMALPRCTQCAALPIWQAAVSLSFCQAASSGLFLLFFPLLSSLCTQPYPLPCKLEEQMYNLGNFPHPSFK